MENNIIKPNDTACLRQISTDIVSAVTSTVVLGDGLITLYFQDRKDLNSCGSGSIKKYSCVYWNYDNSTWDTKGCVYTLITDNNIHKCVCNHLTSFAVLLVI